MDEITMDDRQNDLWFKEDDDTQYALIVMFSVNQTSEPRFVTAGPMKAPTVVARAEAMLNAVEQGRYVCISSHFINPKNVICIKVDKWKSKSDRFCQDGEFYD